MMGSTLTRLEAPFPLVQRFKRGRNSAETIWLQHESAGRPYRSHRAVVPEKDPHKGAAHQTQAAALSVQSDHNEPKDHKILRFCITPGEPPVDKGDRLLSRCVMELEFPLNALRGLRETGKFAGKIWCSVMNFYITVTEQAVESQVMAGTSTWAFTKHVFCLSNFCIVEIVSSFLRLFGNQLKLQLCIQGGNNGKYAQKLRISSASSWLA